MPLPAVRVKPATPQVLGFLEIPDPHGGILVIDIRKILLEGDCFVVTLKSHPVHWAISHWHGPTAMLSKTPTALHESPARMFNTT
jgi:hypothetical protein